ncbi:zona pellucida protein AX 4 [Leuresthes tenuis]|uniref:zona pellucida protein AX 4 n=1 Tax=Leuresthes tenuis TaxID=355514 RepID=UPI003B504F6B
MIRLDFEGISSVLIFIHPNKEKLIEIFLEATLCGYTIPNTDAGDLVFRASFLACHVSSQTGSDYHLGVWLVHVGVDGKVAAYPSSCTAHCRRCGAPERRRKTTWRCPFSCLSSLLSPKMRSGLRRHLLSLNRELMRRTWLFDGAEQSAKEAVVLSLRDAAALGSTCLCTRLGSRSAVILCPGVLQMECRDRYFVTAVDLSVTGDNPVFEAVDVMGTYAITEEYAAKCGYSLNVLPFLGLVELRASYFSCHTFKKDDEFVFNFNLITNDADGQEASYELNKTCSSLLTFSPREVTCEVNFMEVSVKSDLTCPSRTSDTWNALLPAASSPTSDWQVMFQRPDEQMLPMNLTEAREQGYLFDLKHGRIVFRTPYGQPDSYNTEVNDVPVEVVHATVFSRQSWVVLMVDLVAACSMNQGSYSSGYIIWETPDVLYPSVNGTLISVGLNGDLVEQAIAEQMGLIMDKRNTTVKIGIPYKAEGGYRRSFVSSGIFEFYMFHLYFKQISVDENLQQTVIRFHRMLVTPLLPCQLITVDQTVLVEEVFTLYLGNIPEDVELTWVQLNGQDFAVPFSNGSTYSLTEASHPNNTHSFTLKVPLHDPVVIQQYSQETGAMIHMLEVNYTLTVPGGDPYYHTASILASLPVSPPVFEAVCTESGIGFKLDHRPSDYLWEISIGSNLLTSELAARRGYILSNSSQSLLLDVPLFTPGYEYRDVTLVGFLGTFEILVTDYRASVVQTTTKTCPFSSAEFITCSTDGQMTVVADLAPVLQDGETPTSIHLVNELCVPREMGGTRVLFSVPVNSCGSVIKLSKGNVMYQNKIFYSLSMNAFDSDNSTLGVTVQCTYPLAVLHRLFSMYKFESDTEGFGSIHHTVQPTAVLPSPTTAVQATAAPQRTRMPLKYLPAFYPTARYIKLRLNFSLFGKNKLCTAVKAFQRTLHHPSFLSLYMSSFPHTRQGGSQTVHPLTPAELFYTDPTARCGGRIPNMLTGMKVSDFLPLNTPQPIMSACVAAPNHPDPFRFGPHPSRDLGSWRTHTVPPHFKPRRVVVQLTQEEDEAVTNLLKLHHQEALQSDEAHLGFSRVRNPRHFITYPTFNDSLSAEEAHKPICCDVQCPDELQQGGWSAAELEAADTLLSGFNQQQDDCNTSGACVRTQSSDAASFSVGCVWEKGDFWSEEDMSADDCSNPKMTSGSTERVLTVLEGDVVHVLLSLRDVVTFDIFQ